MPNTKAIGVAYADPQFDSLSVSAPSGTSTLVGLFGATPIVQPTTSLEAAAISTAPVSISATQWAFTSSAQAASIITLVNQLRADLVSLGIIKGS